MDEEKNKYYVNQKAVESLTMRIRTYKSQYIEFLNLKSRNIPK
jgi:hypothetical protein